MKVPISDNRWSTLFTEMKHRVNHLKLISVYIELYN